MVVSVRSLFRAAAGLGLALPVSASPYATSVVSYDPGTTPATTFDGTPFTQSSAALGEPTRFTGEGVFPGVVSPFNPPFMLNEVVSIGEGGHLTVGFDRPITNDPSNLFGIDFLIFGNGGFVDDDGDFGNDDGRVADPPLLFGLDWMHVSVSVDGSHFEPLGNFLEGFFPTMGYLDRGTDSPTPGNQPTDFTRPVDPSLTIADFAGLDLAGVKALYNGSGGGTGVDIGPSGLPEVWFVRIDVFDDGDPLTSLNAEIDGFAIVPEPATISLVLVAFAALRRRSA